MNRRATYRPAHSRAYYIVRGIVRAVVWTLMCAVVMCIGWLALVMLWAIATR